MFGTFESRIFSEIKELETLTLFSTLPTLWRTLVATSDIPAWRETSKSCLCASSSLASASLRAVMSRPMPISPTIFPV